MGVIMDILGLGASVASGGLFGLIGSIIGVGAKYFQEKQRQAWEEKKWAQEQAMFELNMQAKAAETEQELAIVSQEGSWRGLEASHEAAASVKNVHTFVNDIRALFRPALTIMLWVISAWIFSKIVSGSVDAWLTGKSPQIVSLVEYMVFSTYFATGTATVWWFGDRALTPASMKNR